MSEEKRIDPRAIVRHAIPAFCCICIVAAIVSGIYDHLHANEAFLSEFNAAVDPALRQDDVSDIKAIAPGYGYYLSAKHYAQLWTFADKYNIAEFPRCDGDPKTQRKAALELVTQLETADRYIESNYTAVIVLVALAVFTVVLYAWTGKHEAEKTRQQFLYEFNAAVSQELHQDDVSIIKSIAPGYWLAAEDWAAIWNFADKYDIAEFPEYNGDMYTQRDISQKLVAQLRAADEYIESNNIDKAAASRLLNQAFATSNGNLVTVLQTEND